MSDAENGEGVSGIPGADAKFLIACLQNTTGGSISIDHGKVADALGYKNPRSVSNKVALLKKKYNLPLGGGGNAKATPDKTGSRKASDATEPNEPAIPKTPSKQRVSKPRASSTKKATPKSKEVKSEEETKTEDKDEDEDTKLEVKAAQEQVFGKSEEDEDVENEYEDAYA